MTQAFFIVVLHAQGGTVEDDGANGVAVTESGDIVLAGYTSGDWTKEIGGGMDFAAVR